jgi:hypothetical protein
MANPITIESPSGLSNTLGAYDEAHWQTVVAQLKPNSGLLKRGSVLSAVVADAGALTLTVATSEPQAYGILLDSQIDTAVLNSDGTVTGSVARAGSFRGAALIVGAGCDEAALEKQLRLLGIFCEGPIAPVA